RNYVIAQLFTDPRTAGTTARERAISQAAIAPTESPKSFAADRLQPSGAQGMTLEEIRDVSSAVATFASANRLMMHLGEHVSPNGCTTIEGAASRWTAGINAPWLTT